MEFIKSPLTPAEHVEMLDLKEAIDIYETRYAVLADKLKAGQSEDGVIWAGDKAFVLYSQERLDAKKFLAKYPKETHLFKTVPDSTKVRKEFSDEKFTGVAMQVRALKIMPLEKAVAEAEKFAKK